VSCLYYYNAAGQPKTSPKPAQNSAQNPKTPKPQNPKEVNKSVKR
jgi:hypothetical protein